MLVQSSSERLLGLEAGVGSLRLFSKNPSNLSITSPGRLKRSFPFWPLVLSGMVVLLATVAVLQYRWTDEVSAATELRIGTELESLMTRWHADLYGEFSAICSAMQVAPDSGARDTWDDYLERYVEWRNVLGHETLVDIYRNPDLVRNVYIWDTNLQSKPQLFRLNADKKKIEVASVPQDLQTLLARLRANSTSLSMSLRVWQSPDQPGQGAGFDTASGASSPGSNKDMGWQFDENIPALVHPIFQRDTKPLSRRSPVDWMVIVLDWNAIQKRVLPELATRYFGSLDGLDYKVAVIKTGPTPRVIYSSEAGFGIRDVGAVDSSMSIFVPLSRNPEDHFRQSVKKSRSLRSADWHSFFGPVWFPVIEYGSRPDPWVLVVQHRAAPLQAVIRQVRQKNLAISALVLLLLAVSIGVLAIVGFRAQKFAKLQMDFVASISHELRTPLTAIFSAGENIKDGLVRGKPGLARYGSIIMGQTRQLMDHVDRVLLFASIRSGKDRYNLRPLPLAEILRQVRKSVSALIREDSWVVEEHVPPDLPCVVGDLYAVCGCLENLITNAIKYGGNDRRIRLSAMLHESENNRREIAISVEDHGMGISSPELSRVFEPFYRSPNVREAQIHGTGLGLSVTKHLAEAMGGRLSVTSEVGVGSVFTLYLPAVSTREYELSTVSSTCDEVTGNE